MNFDDCYFLIPAREGSKGFPFKNRKLFDETASIIPQALSNRVFVSTDDIEIQNEAKKYNFNVVNRPKRLSMDTSSLKDVLVHFVESEEVDKKATIILMFLTYPERTWKDVLDILSFFQIKQANSLICAEEVKEHPYLCFYELDDNKGKLVINHELYRRQDYPICFRQSMFLGCYKADIINELHDLLFEKDTVFYKLDTKKIDVDYEEDYNESKSR